MSGPEIEWQEYEYDLECGAHVKVVREIVYLDGKKAIEKVVA